MDTTGLVMEKTWIKVQEEECIMVLVPKLGEHPAHGFMHWL